MIRIVDDRFDGIPKTDKRYCNIFSVYPVKDALTSRQ
jgi:hypothetical protein